MEVVMSEWKEIEFAKILEDESISYGIVQPGSHIDKGGIPIIRVQNIKNGKILPNGIKKVHKNIESGYLRTRLKGGELLITVVGSVGECAIVTNDFIGWNVARAVSVAKIKIGYDKEFIRYCFATEDLKFQMYGSTNDTVQPTLNLKELKALKLSVPVLVEQKAIAEVLSSLDDKIDLLHRQNKTLEQMAETLFRQWFVEEAKEDWEEGILSDFGEITTGKTPSKNFPDYWGEEFNFITPTDFKNFGMFTNQTQRNLSKLGWSKMTSLQLPEFSVLVTCIGSDMGKVTISSKPCITNQQLNSIILKDNNYLGFVFEFIKSQYGLLRNIAFGGTTMPIINKSVFSNIHIPNPPKRKIEEYQTIWKSFGDEILKNQNQIRTLEKMRDTLLPKLMSGEVRVSK